MPTRRQYALLAVAVGGVLIVAPLLHGPVTPAPYEYEVSETTLADRPIAAAMNAPDVRTCHGEPTSRRCAFERLVADRGPLTHTADRYENVSAGVHEDDIVFLVEHGFRRSVRAYDGDGSVRFAHEPVDDDELIDAIVVAEERVRRSEAAVESIETGRVITDEPVEIWENRRTAEYEGNYYAVTAAAHRPPAEPDHWTVARGLSVIVGFGLVLYGRGVHAVESRK